MPSAAGNVLAIQTAIWVVTDDISRDELAASQAVVDSQIVKAVLQAAGLNPQCKRLFNEIPCTPTPGPLSTTQNEPTPSSTPVPQATVEPTNTPDAALTSPNSLTFGRVISDAIISPGDSNNHKFTGNSNELVMISFSA